MSQATIRALTFRASGAIEAWCRRRGLSHPCVDAFCNGLRDLATATDVPKWNERMNSLELTGLGDPMPSLLAIAVGADLERFDEMVQSAREISASQIFGADDRNKIQMFYARTCGATGVDPTLPEVFTDPTIDGCWGGPISASLASKWIEENKRMESNG